MPNLPIAAGDEVVMPGEAYLEDTPVLRSHAGTQPDLFMRWNRIPFSAASVDVLVYLHGFSQEGAAMVLAEKVRRSGLDLSGRTRPTLALLPRGNWLRHYYYDFPALLGGGIDDLVDYGIARFFRAAAACGAASLAAVDRFILSAHSGGGMPAIDILAEARRPPDEFYVFDGLYGRDPATGDPLRGLDIIDRWLADRFAREPQRHGALRVVYIEQQTGRFSHRVGELVARHLAAANPSLRAELSRRYRVEISRVQHSQIAHYCQPRLLAAAAAEFNWFA
jgi:hypothetical protein